MSNLDPVTQSRDSARVWTTASETLSTRWGFRELFEKRPADVCIPDVGWCGGLSEAKKIATMAECYSCHWRRTTAPVGGPWNFPGPPPGTGELSSSR